MPAKLIFTAKKKVAMYRMVGTRKYYKGTFRTIAGSYSESI